MSLPSSRNRTYGVGDQIRSQDLNDIQDYLLAHEAALRGSRDFIVAAGPHGTPGNAANWAPNLNGNWESSVGNPDRLFLDIPLRDGDIITAVTVYLQHSTATAGLITAKLETFDIASGSRADMSNLMSSANVTTVQAIALTGLGLGVGTDGLGNVKYTGTKTFNVKFDGTATATTRKIYGAKVTYTRP